MSEAPATKHVRREEEEEDTPSTTTNAAIQAAEASIAAFTTSIAKLEKELEEAKGKMKKWDERVEKALDEGKTGDELERLTKQQDNATKAVENAQAALNKEKDRLQEEKKLLDKEKDRQQELLLEKEKLVAQTGKDPFYFQPKTLTPTSLKTGEYRFLSFPPLQFFRLIPLLILWKATIRRKSMNTYIVSPSKRPV